MNDQNEVIAFQEKPDDPKSTLVSIACYGFPSGTLPKFDAYLRGDNNPDEPGWFIQWLQDRESVHAFTFEEAWFDIGTPQSYLDAIAWHLDGDNHIHSSVELTNIDLGENVQILEDATIEDATITDSVIFPETTIKHSELRRSLIDTDTHLESLGGSYEVRLFTCVECGHKWRGS